MENLMQLLSEIEKQNTNDASKIKAYHKLGDDLQKNDLKREALGCFQAAHALDQSNIVSSIALSKAYKNINKATLALEVLKPHLKNKPVNLHVGLNAINILKACNKKTEVDSLLIRLEAAYPNNFHVQLKKGQQLVDKELIRESIEVFDALEAIANNQQIVFLALANANAKVQISKTPEAIESLKNALKLNPKNLQLTSKLISLLITQQKYEEASSLCVAALKENPHQLKLKLQWAELLDTLASTKQTIDFLESINEEEKDNPFYFLHLSRYKTQVGEIFVAKKILLEGLKRFPKNIFLLESLSINYKNQGQFNKALELLDRIETQSAQEESRIAINRGLNYLHLYNYKDAIKNIEEAQEKNDNALSKIKLSGIYNITGKIEEAYNLLDSASHEVKDNLSLLNGIKPLRSHAAMICNEMRSHPSYMIALTEIEKIRDNATRLESLRDLVKQDENYLGSAMYFLKELRLQGQFSQKHTKEKTLNSEKIPKKIFQYWDSIVIPSDVNKNGLSWQKHNPEFEYIRIKKRIALEYLEDNYPARFLDAFVKCDNAAMEADFMRLAILNKEGGFYADVDDKCLQPLDNLDLRSHQFVIGQEIFACLGNNFIASVPGHPIIKSALEMVVRNLLEYSKESAWFKTGPAILTLATAKYLVENSFTKMAERGEFILSQALLRQVIFQHMHLAYKKTDKSWFREAYL